MQYRICTITDLGAIGRGKSKHRPRNDSILYGGQYPFIQTADVKKAILHLNEYSQTYNEVGLNQSKLWKKGTLCFTIAANIAESAILDIDACFPDSVVGFIPFECVADTGYVKYLMDELKLYFQQISKGTTQDNLSLEKICRVKLQVPDYKIQKKIAFILSSYDNLIENNNKRIKLLEQMAENLYKEWFVRFRFPGYENAEFENGIPKGWDIKRLSEYGRIETGKTPSTEETENYGGDIMFIKTPDMHDNMFVIQTEEKLSEQGHRTQPKKLLPANSISVSCIGTGGVVAINAEPAHTNQQINSIILNDINELEWLYHTCKSLKKTIEMFGATGATMTNLSKGKFEKLKVIDPGIDLILAYHRKTRVMFDEIKSLMYKNQNLAKQRDLLLPRLMSGKLEV